MAPTPMYMPELPAALGTKRAPVKKRPVALVTALLIATSGLLVTASPAGAADAPARTTWLCFPGMANNPCGGDISVTHYDARRRVISVTHESQSDQNIDCFYVYPTTSDEPTPQADFNVTPELRSIALYQASRYASECRVFAPVYRQITIQGLFGGDVTPEMRETAYQDVRSAWLDYLANDNHGRGVLFIGHSQGAGVLRRLLADEVDPKPAVRRLLVAGILLGGNVTVKKGQDVGGDFQNVPACRRRTQFGCVIVYSTFGAPVPDTSFFGRTTNPDLEVLCTNPAALGGGAAPISPSQPTEPFAPGTAIGGATGAVATPAITATTTWVEYRYAYRAQCSSAGGANVLQITPLGISPTLNAIPDPTWGLHLVDANIELGDLVKLVHGQGERFVRSARLRAWRGGFVRSAARHLGHALLHLFRRDVLDVRRDVPTMSERVDELSRTVAVELVLDRTQFGRAVLERAVERDVDVLDVHTHGHRSVAELLRADEIHVRNLVGEHDHRVADRHLGMPDLPVRPTHTHGLGCAEHRRIEVDRVRRAVDGQVRNHARVLIGNGLHGHASSPSSGEHDHTRRCDRADEPRPGPADGRALPGEELMASTRCRWPPLPDSPSTPGNEGTVGHSDADVRARQDSNLRPSH